MKLNEIRDALKDVMEAEGQAMSDGDRRTVKAALTNLNSVCREPDPRTVQEEKPKKKKEKKEPSIMDGLEIEE